MRNRLRNLLTVGIPCVLFFSVLLAEDLTAVAEKTFTVPQWFAVAFVTGVFGLVSTFVTVWLNAKIKNHEASMKAIEGQVKSSISDTFNETLKEVYDHFEKYTLKLNCLDNVNKEIKDDITDIKKTYDNTCKKMDKIESVLNQLQETKFVKERFSREFDNLWGTHEKYLGKDPDLKMVGRIIYLELKDFCMIIHGYNMEEVDVPSVITRAEAVRDSVRDTAVQYLGRDFVALYTAENDKYCERYRAEITEIFTSRRNSRASRFQLQSLTFMADTLVTLYDLWCHRNTALCKS